VTRASTEATSPPPSPSSSHAASSTGRPTPATSAATSSVHQSLVPADIEATIPAAPLSRPSGRIGHAPAAHTGACWFGHRSSGRTSLRGVAAAGDADRSPALILCRSNTRLPGGSAQSPAAWRRWWLAGRVLLEIAYWLVRRVPGLAVLVRKDRAKDAELLVPRHENPVLRRPAGRIRYEPADRVWLAALARLVPRRRWAGVFPRDASDAAAGTAGRPRASTTRADGARPAARQRSAASPAVSSAWRTRIRCGATAGSTASRPSPASQSPRPPSVKSCGLRVPARRRAGPGLAAVPARSGGRDRRGRPSCMVTPCC
jgi:hypothetical protein